MSFFVKGYVFQGRTVTAQSPTHAVISCKCGAEGVVPIKTLQDLAPCAGCLIGRRNAKHGHAGTNRSPTYDAWSGLKQANSGLGWETFEDFLCDLGPRPENHGLHRTDPSKPWGPGNAIWQPTGGHHTNARLFDVNGVTHSIQSAARAWNVTWKTARRRLANYPEKAR